MQTIIVFNTSINFLDKLIEKKEYSNTKFT